MIYDNRHIPYGPDWPDKDYHPDWPHYRRHAWNDTEPATVVPWHDECCPEPSDPCICVTSGDVELWNTISAVSAFSKFDLSGLSGLSALSGLSEILPMASAVDAYSGIWMSAEYVPEIFDELSAISAKVDTKAPLSAEYLNRVYSDPYFFDGAGTMKSVLKPSQDLKDTVDLVYASSDGFTKRLVNTDECDQVEKSLKALNSRTVEQGNKVAHLESVVAGISAVTTFQGRRIGIEESKQYPNTFFYFDSTKTE